MMSGGYKGLDEDRLRRLIEAGRSLVAERELEPIQQKTRRSTRADLVAYVREHDLL
jgi:hypothetical protein